MWPTRGRLAKRGLMPRRLAQIYRDHVPNRGWHGIIRTSALWTLCRYRHKVHELLHKAERRTATTKTVRETEVEAVAFVVGKAVGLVTGSASTDYIQVYHGNASLLAESLEVIQQTASVILAVLESPIAEQAASDDLAEVAA